VVLYYHRLDNLDMALAKFKILSHTDLSFSKDSELLPKFQDFMQTLRKIDGLGKELEALKCQGMMQEPFCQA
jgi:hypothetical protein